MKHQEEFIINKGIEDISKQRMHVAKGRHIKGMFAEYGYVGINETKGTTEAQKTINCLCMDHRRGLCSCKPILLLIK